MIFLTIYREDIRYASETVGFVPASRYGSMVPVEHEIGAVEDVRLIAGGKDPRDMVMLRRQKQLRKDVAAGRGLESIQAECGLYGHHYVCDSTHSRHWGTPTGLRRGCIYCEAPRPKE